MALRGGLAGVASNIATGQSPFSLAGGIKGKATDLGNRSMFDVFKNPKDYFMDGDKSNIRNYAEGFFKGKDDELEIPAELLGKKRSDLTIEEEQLLEDILDKKKKGIFGDMSFGQIASLYGLGTAGLGLLIDKTSDEQDVGLPANTIPEGNVLQGILNPTKVYAASGGVMDLQDGGESIGPGTGTSDSIPAMLSDGEFVMTAEAVRGAGGGDRREGAKKMYEAMDKLEARA